MTPLLTLLAFTIFITWIYAWWSLREIIITPEDKFLVVMTGVPWMTVLGLAIGSLFVN